MHVHAYRILLKITHFMHKGFVIFSINWFFFSLFFFLLFIHQYSPRIYYIIVFSYFSMISFFQSIFLRFFLLAVNFFFKSLRSNPCNRSHVHFFFHLLHFYFIYNVCFYSSLSNWLLFSHFLLTVCMYFVCLCLS